MSKPETPKTRIERYLDAIEEKVGSGVFIATYTLTPTESGFTATCDKTGEELDAAYTSGQQLQARCLIDALGMDLRLASYSYVQDDMDGNCIVFLGVGRTGTVAYLQITHFVTNTIFTQVIPLATAD